ncbi:hypothetical protein KGF54_000724 [Candida jiufengensis]|uniref:uncharacterized protein n=1 Tax=Candida jiufengensis TaxID=497108 RepID=UPI0022255085|nr:uncharacterized protein KGF54_000724 [Candida jiufengensis]KAI5956249.1 hypothetical protein KGF54_000724 [Candida jiufengensis]
MSTNGSLSSMNHKNHTHDSNQRQLQESNKPKINSSSPKNNEQNLGPTNNQINNNHHSPTKSKYHKYSRSKDKWIFPEYIALNQTPSRLDKHPIPISHELRLKESIHEFIIRLGKKLKVDGPTILATTIYLHRFYMTTTITVSKYFVASAAFALSCKLNDNYRQPDKISLISCNLKNPLQPLINKENGQKVPPPPIDEQSKIYWEWKDQLLYREELILKKLKFDLNFISPYFLQYKILNKIHIGMGEILYNNRKEIIKSTISLIEILSSLPIILCYDMKEIFATCFIIILVEGEIKFKNDIKLSKKFLKDVLGSDLNVVTHCFKFIKKLLRICQDDHKMISNKVAAKRILPIKSIQFIEIARGE